MFKYFISKEFFLTLLGLFFIGLVMYFLIFFLFLPAYTRHGDAVLVPDITEASYEEAIAQLKKNGLRYEVRDCTYIPDLEPLTVISQYPVSFSRVKPKRKVFLTINQQTPPIVKVPEIVDITFYQAKSQLESWKLGVGTVTKKPDIAENVVLEAKYLGKELKGGEYLPQGAKIDLVVGDGYKNARMVSLPDLIGLTYEDAITELKIRGLGLGKVVYDPNGPEEEMGFIFRQSPQPDRGIDEVREGYPMIIYVYGEEPEFPENPFEADSIENPTNL